MNSLQCDDIFCNQQRQLFEPFVYISLFRLDFTIFKSSYTIPIIIIIIIITYLLSDEDCLLLLLAILIGTLTRNYVLIDLNLPVVTFLICEIPDGVNAYLF